MNPWGAITDLIIGFHRTGKAQEWSRLFASLAGSCFVAYHAIYGAQLRYYFFTVGPAAGEVLARSDAHIALAATFLAAWASSPLTRKLTITVLGDVAKAVGTRGASSASVG